MIGRRNLRLGPRIGPRIGVGDGSAMAGVSRDATSNIFVPANSTEWTTTMSAAGIASGVPSLLWLCQEASGNLADSLDSFTGTASGTLTYQQAITGWSRFGITGADNGTGVVETTSASLPDPTAASMLVLVYATVTSTPGGTRVMTVTGNANQTIQRFTSTPRMQGVSGGNVGTGTVSPVGGVRPYFLKYDFTGNTVRAGSDQEILTIARAAMTGKRHRIAWNFPGSVLYVVSFMSAAAELSDASLRTLLQTLGWTIAW